MSRRRDAGIKRDDYVMTLEQISLELGVTRERIRQLEVNGLRKAKTILEKRGFSLRDWLEGSRD